MKKILSLALILTLILALLAGCAKKEDKVTESPKEDKVVAEKDVFIPALDTQQATGFSIVGHLDNFEALEAVITEFKKYYPNVNISYEKMGDYNNMIATRMENDPGVGCCLDAPHDHCEELLAHGYDISDFGEAINAGMENGKLYAIPLGIDVSGFMVNVTLLEKEGLKVPTNYAEFTSVCEALVAKGYTPIHQTGEAIARFVFQNSIWETIASANDFDALIATLSSGEKGSYECMRPVFEMAKEFFDKGYTKREINNALPNYYDAAILHFFEGNVPFMAANIDTVSGMGKREVKSEAFTANPFTYQFIYAPLDADGVCAKQGSWRLLSVNKNAANKDLALEFIRFAGRKENLNLLAKVKGLPSASKEQTDPRFAHINEAKGKYVHSWDYTVSAKLTNSTIGRLKEYCIGDIATIDEALRLIENDIWEEKQAS